MSSIHETAYPRIKSDLTQKELDEIYTPTEEELVLATEEASAPVDRLYFLVLLKLTQRLGYFVLIKSVPKLIISHIANHINVTATISAKITKHDKSGARQRFMNIVRRHMIIKPFNRGGEELAQTVAERAADI